MRPSVMNHSFSEIPRANIPRSVFNRTHSRKMMFEGGDLIPFLVDEILPGDSFTVSATLFARLSNPLTYPIMDNLFMDTFYFFVPNRLLWGNWEKFCGAQDNPGDSIDYTIPTMPSPLGGWQVGTLSDYFGLPCNNTGMSGQVLNVNALPYRAYNLIWNEWFRDENLQNSITIPSNDGPDSTAWANIKKRNKKHDYLTSCLPWPQKGTAVDLPLGTQAPVKGIGKETNTWASGTASVYESDGSQPNYSSFQEIDPGTADESFWVQESATNSGYPGIYADLSNATAATINQLREAFQIQKLMERDARGGTRYTEIVRSHFGVVSPDARLQRPEFLGGRSTPVYVNPVQQTSESGTTKQGNLAAYAHMSSNNEGFTKSFTEHGYLIGLVNIRADITYQQGIDRMWSRSTRYDFYWPALSHIGEQPVYQKEIYATGVTNDDNTVFGYQERYAEYRYKQSQICGHLRSTHTTPLDAWHLSEEFASAPTLSDSFITSSDESVIDRISAVTSGQQIVFDSYIKMRCVRPMPVYSVPGMIDHF